MKISTADISDQYGSALTLLNIELQSFGKKEEMAGQVVTLKVYEDNSFVRKILSEKGTGKVLVIDGGGSRRCALVGDEIAQLAIDKGWEGIIVFGCIRDVKVINAMNIAIKALGTCPVKSVKRNVGLVGEDLLIAGTRIKPDHYVYADTDGVLLSEVKLDLSQ